MEMTKEERVRTGRLARLGSIFTLVLAVAACSSTATQSPAVVTRSAEVATQSPIPTSSPTAGPTPSPTPSPRPMAPATLKAGPKMATARTGQAAVRLKDGRVLIMGGTVPFVGKCPMACMPPATASVEIYNPGTGKFSHNGSLANPRGGGDALLLNDGRVLVSGGDGEYGGGSSTIEIYDPAHGTSVVVNPPAAQKLPIYPTVVLLADGRVLVAGGSYDDSNTTSTATLIFDPSSGGWSNGPLMAKPRQGAMATLLDYGRVLLVGGDYYEGSNGYPNNSVELIDPSRAASNSTLLFSLAWQTATKLPDGRVLVTGGGLYKSDTTCKTSVPTEVFDPRTERFTAVGPMSTRLSGSAAIGIPDGRVLFFGGVVDSDCEAVGTVEAFDPDSGKFHVIATGFPALTGFSATLLNDGRILVAGGDNGSWNGMTAATWLLKP
jgi:hypothetical protein